MEQELDYKKACEEALNSMEQEFENGAKAMLRYIQEKGTCCYGSDNCVICEAGRKFLRRRKKKLQVLF